MSSIQEKKPPKHTMKRICKLVKDSETNETFKDFIEEMCRVTRHGSFGSSLSSEIASTTLAFTWQCKAVTGNYA